MVQTVKDVIPAPEWMRKAMKASSKQRGITAAEALLQTQNALKGRTEKEAAQPAVSSDSPIKQSD
jgi:hypothetical protein